MRKVYNLLCYFTVQVSKMSTTAPSGDNVHGEKRMFVCVWGSDIVTFVALENMDLR